VVSADERDVAARATELPSSTRAPQAGAAGN
jgi:hypothetical protein